MASQTRLQISNSLNVWKANTLDITLVNTAPLIFPNAHNNVLTELKEIIDNINQSMFNRIEGVPQTSVVGLIAALANKEPADVTILKEASIVDNVVTQDPLRPLSANQGYLLQQQIDAITVPGNFDRLSEGTPDEVTAVEIRAHLDDLSIHFTEVSINHDNIQNRGTNTHADIDNHIADVTNPHSVTKTQIGLGNVLNIDTSIAANITFTPALGIGATNVQQALQELATNIQAVDAASLKSTDIVDNLTSTSTADTLSANQGRVLNDLISALVPADGSIDTHSDVNLTGINNGDTLVWNGSQLVAGTALVTSVNGQGGAVVLDADDIDDTSTVHRFASAGQLAKIDLVSITSPINLDILASDVSINNAKVSANGSVTTHSDVTDAGSGQIITSLERTKLNGIENGATGDQIAAEVPYVNAVSGLLATDLQSAIDETVARLSAIDGGTSGIDAGDIPFTPTVDISSTDVQAAIEEVRNAIETPALGHVTVEDSTFTSVSPLNLTGTPTHLNNDATVYDTTFGPVGSNGWWNVANQEFRPETIGDVYRFTVHFTVNPVTNNVPLFMEFFEISGNRVVDARIDYMSGGAGVARRLSVTFTVVATALMVSDYAKIRFNTTGNLNVYDFSFEIERTFKA